MSCDDHVPSLLYVHDDPSHLSHLIKLESVNFTVYVFHVLEVMVAIIAALECINVAYEGNETLKNQTKV